VTNDRQSRVQRGMVLLTIGKHHPTCQQLHAYIPPIISRLTSSPCSNQLSGRSSLHENEVFYEARSQVKSYDKPLFVLKYQKRKLILYIVAMLFLMAMIYFCLFVVVVSSTLDFIIAKLGGL
jgi:hypothetical protein